MHEHTVSGLSTDTTNSISDEELLEQLTKLQKLLEGYDSAAQDIVLELIGKVLLLALRVGNDAETTECSQFQHHLSSLSVHALSM